MQVLLPVAFMGANGKHVLDNIHSYDVGSVSWPSMRSPRGGHL
jgi:hypothetical protein